MIKPFNLFFALKIKDGLFIGDGNSLNEEEFLIQNKITNIVNCSTSETINKELNLGIKYLCFYWLDVDD
jgi:hypothetical protein